MDGCVCVWGGVAHPDVVERGLAGDVVEQKERCSGREGAPLLGFTQTFI